MSIILNTCYGLLLLVLSPYLLYKSLTTGKYRAGLWRKLTGNIFKNTTLPYPRVWFHGVSVGEIHLLRHLVTEFRRRHPDWQCVISSTTDTGFAEANICFPDLAVIWWPFDFSWSVRRALQMVKPSLVVLAEGETWPNFVRTARQLEVPVAVVNARMSPRSFGRYQKLAWLVRPLFRIINCFAVQTEEYADHYLGLGARSECVSVTGSVKYDGVSGDRNQPRTIELGRLLQVQSDDLIWIAGSTQAPEEETVLRIYQSLKVEYPNLRLFLVPRQKNRFEEVARLLQRSDEPFIRRSQLVADSPLHSLILVDSIGELGALWGLVDIAFVGGSMDGKRGGQNMIEPASYGAAVVFGPHIWNFREPARCLLECGAAIQVKDEKELEQAVRQLCADPMERQRRGNHGRALVRQQQGATARTIELLSQLMEKSGMARAG